MRQPDERRPLASLTTFCLMLAAAYCVAYPGVVAGAQTPGRDYGSYSYPVAVYAKRSILHGLLPALEPLQPQRAALFCPVESRRCFILRPSSTHPADLVPACALHVPSPRAGRNRDAAALLSMTGKDRAASLAGFSFGFSGLPLSLLCWPAHCAAYGLAPWVILSSLRAARPSPRKRLAAAILVTALPDADGQPRGDCCDLGDGGSGHACTARPSRTWPAAYHLGPFGVPCGRPVAAVPQLAAQLKPIG